METQEGGSCGSQDSFISKYLFTEVPHCSNQPEMVFVDYG